MKPIREEDIDKMLSRMKTVLPANRDPHALENILKRMEAEAPAAHVRFQQVRNAGIAILLVIAVNIIVMSRSANDSTPSGRVIQEHAPYLQPYNLNLY